MKQKLMLVLAISMLATSAFAQNFAGPKKGPLFGLHFNLMDFKAPNGIKDPITGKVYSSIRDMSKGLSLAYWRGLSNKVDLSLKGNIMFHDYSALYSNITGKQEIGLELEPSLHLRPYGDNHLIAPFLSAGVGAGMYNDKFGAYAPAGLGVQLNFNSITYLILQGQYRFTLTKDVYPDNLFYSIGLAQNIGREKPMAIAPPPPPAIEAPKDRDGDGVLDADDKCPDVAGVASLQGCPDSDGDGIADADDKCPSVAGVARYQGCPIPDGDGDGINDEEDKCPTVRGVARYQGCPIPDTDNDGVNDEEDKCVNEAGPASNFGCPVINEAVVKRINAAAKIFSLLQVVLNY
ncbi:MAG: thrombospondin type 3 repeat-containing protein [Chitinophagaceae bacterium]|nr:thrombospondin type 3 repeat-containing protein [Chitinophagaceae bacterium]